MQIYTLFFTGQKSFYSRSEWRTAFFTCGSITNQRQRKYLGANQSRQSFAFKENNNTLSKTQSSLLKKFLVSRNEQSREMENIDARDLDVLIANFLLQVRKKERDNDTTPHR